MELKEEPETENGSLGGLGEMRGAAITAATLQSLLSHPLLESGAKANPFDCYPTDLETVLGK